MELRPPFELRNADADGPVIVSVPHAGRDYGAWTARLRPPPERIVSLEDRYADALVATLTDVPVLIAQRPRVYVDLNRHEAEIDPGLVDGVIPSRLILSTKVRGGLGVVPRRLAGVGELWRGRLSASEVEERLATVHRPYHQALRQLLRRAIDRHGIAVLLDLHSMPSLTVADGEVAPVVVVGNRFGQSAAAWATGRIGAICRRLNLEWRENSPYAGGHIAERHGAPAHGLHAIQVEFDRSLYLDADGDRTSSAKVEAVQRVVSEMARELAAGARSTGLPIAAE